MLMIIVVIIVIVCITIYLSDPTVKGRRGEKSIARCLEFEGIKGRPGYVLKNVYLPRATGGTTEVDLMYITSKGIFVIESKNYAGYIFGKESSKDWTVTLYAGQGQVEKIKFYNPVWQNNTHMKCLKEYLDKNVNCFSFVVFSDRCELKDINVTRPNTFVLYASRLSSLLKDLWKDLPDLYSEEEIRMMYECLKKLEEADKEMRSEHVENINKRLNDITTCPSCGGKLVLRTARHGSNAGGQFYGCENYPKCRFIKNL